VTRTHWQQLALPVPLADCPGRPVALRLALARFNFNLKPDSRFTGKLNFGPQGPPAGPGRAAAELELELELSLPVPVKFKFKLKPRSLPVALAHWHTHTHTHKSNGLSDAPGYGTALRDSHDYCATGITHWHGESNGNASAKVSLTGTSSSIH